MLEEPTMLSLKFTLRIRLRWERAMWTRQWCFFFYNFEIFHFFYCRSFIANHLSNEQTSTLHILNILFQPYIFHERYWTFNWHVSSTSLVDLWYIIWRKRWVQLPYFCCHTFQHWGDTLWSWLIHWSTLWKVIVTCIRHTCHRITCIFSVLFQHYNFPHSLFPH